MSCDKFWSDLVSPDQISETGNLDVDLIKRQYNLDLVCRFMEIKSHNPKITQKQVAQHIAFSVSTIKR